MHKFNADLHTLKIIITNHSYGICKLKLVRNRPYTRGIMLNFASKTPGFNSCSKCLRVLWDVELRRFKTCCLVSYMSKMFLRLQFLCKNRWYKIRSDFPQLEKGWQHSRPRFGIDRQAPPPLEVFFLSGESEVSRPVGMSVSNS